MLRVRLFGEVALEYDDAPLPLDSLRLQSLIGLLVLRRDAPQDRARVAFELWPDSTESQARTNLRHLVHDLRNGLPEIDQVVHTTNRTLQWRPQVPTRVDVEVFETALDEAATAPDEDAVRAALEAAVAAYGGDLLPNSWDDWVLAARDRMRSRAVAALEAVAGLLDAQNQDQAARGHWERLLQLDPVNETGYRGLMRSYAASGDRGRALRVYHTCVSVLERELGLPPSRETTEVYESLVRGDAATGRPQAAVATTDALVGRDLEWAEVVGAWRKAMESGPHVLVVTGEPGIGKSRIVDELARSCEAEGGAVARARAYEAGGRLPYLPVTDWLRSDLVARHVARLDRVWRAEVARLVPDVSDEEPEREEYITDPARRRRLLEAIGHAFSIGRPLLLVLDDVQWTDPDTIDVVHHLALQAGPRPLLVAATIRDGEMTPEHPAVPVLHELRRAGLITSVALERLGRDATLELVQRLDADVGDPDRLEQLWRETDGNPLFVIEATRAGFPGVEGGLTKTVQSMILSRLASLSEPTRRITELAATSGRAFTVELLTSASGGDEEVVLDALDELWHRRIVREQGAGYDFTHDKLREVAYLAVSPVRRRRLHRAIGDAIASVHADDPTVSTDLAQHRERGGQYLEIAVRGGGHSVPGFGTCDDGVVIDLSPMRWVRVDPTHQTARVGGGALWGDFDHAAHPHGLATPGGVISSTGVSGLTLGGGIGHLSRRHGLSCDNLLSADVVTAGGEVVTASDYQHEDLFWALRGGGGNFGVVTSMEFQLHPVAQVYGGPIFYEAGDAGDVLRFYREFIAGAPEELGAFFAWQIAPPLPFIPEGRHGETMCAIVTCWSGPPEEGETMLRPLFDVAPVVAHHTGLMPYPALNGAFDPLLPSGLQHYWKADFVAQLTDDAIAGHVEHGSRVPAVQSTMHLYPIDGAVQRVRATETAFAYRDVAFACVIAGMWPDPADNEANTAWVRDYYAAIHPHSGVAGGYVNFMAGDDGQRVRDNYGPNYDRLVAVKDMYDPGNVFHLNQNIRPSA